MSVLVVVTCVAEHQRALSINQSKCDTESDWRRLLSVKRVRKCYPFLFLFVLSSTLSRSHALLTYACFRSLYSIACWVTGPAGFIANGTAAVLSNSSATCQFAPLPNTNLTLGQYAVRFSLWGNASTLVAATFVVVPPPVNALPTLSAFLFSFCCALLCVCVFWVVCCVFSFN